MGAWQTEIPDPPVAPAAFGDFNNDKHTDVILAAHNAYYGYMWERRPGSKLYGSDDRPPFVVFIRIPIEPPYLISA